MSLALPDSTLFTAIPAADTPLLTLVPQAPTPSGQTNVVDDLDNFLSDLLSESMAEQDARKRLKEARKEVKHTGLAGSKKLALQQEIKELEYVAEWSAVCDVIWIKRCVCDQCGSETPQFAGYFRKSHSRLSNAYRWTALSSEVESDLPREMKTEMTSVAMCADCIPQILMEDGWMTLENMEEEVAHAMGAPHQDTEGMSEEEAEEALDLEIYEPAEADEGE